MMSCSATAISSSSNRCSGLSDPLAGLPFLLGTTVFGVAAAFTTRAMSASPFHVRDGAGELPSFGFQSRHPLRVPAPFGLGQLADYPTVHTLHAFQPDSLRKLNGDFVIDIWRGGRPGSSNQVLLLNWITGQFGLERARATALVGFQHTDENASIAFVELLRTQRRSNSIESLRPDGQELDQVTARRLLPCRTFSVRPWPGPVAGRPCRARLALRLLGLDGKQVGLDPDPPGRPLPVTLADGHVLDPAQNVAGLRRRHLHVVRVAGIQARQ